MKSYPQPCTHFWFHPPLPHLFFFIQINTIDQLAIRLQNDHITHTRLHTNSYPLENVSTVIIYKHQPSCASSAAALWSVTRMYWFSYRCFICCRTVLNTHFPLSSYTLINGCLGAGTRGVVEDGIKNGHLKAEKGINGEGWMWKHNSELVKRRVESGDNHNHICKCRKIFWMVFLDLYLMKILTHCSSSHQGNRGGVHGHHHGGSEG